MNNKVYPKLKNVTPLEDYRILLEYDNGEKRVYDFKPNLDHSYYKELENIELFKKVFINNGDIQWASGQDFCPNTLYEQSKVIK